MEMVNGYVFLDLTKTNVYSKALKVLGTDKPVVIKDGSGSPYFVDSLTLDGTNVVITKGGKTITIANDNTITSEGDIQNHLYQHRIIIEGNVDGDTHTLASTFYSTKSTPMTLDDVVDNNNYLFIVAPINTDPTRVDGFGYGTLETLDPTGYLISLNNGDNSLDFDDTPNIKDSVTQIY